jgi:UDP-N-acetylmuramoyl-L-alanyl-D-glutamate--2,6-diaminopimelate ligase
MKKLIHLLEGLEYTCDRDVSGLCVDFVSNDSRKATEDTLFIAIKGAVSDGHNYIDMAY